MSRDTRFRPRSQPDPASISSSAETGPPDAPDEMDPVAARPLLEVIQPDNPEFDDEDDPEPDEDFDDEATDFPRTVMITGASGNIGRKLRAAWVGMYDLVLVDSAADADDPEVLPIDLAEMTEELVDAFAGVDTVVHLAGNPNEFASWEELERPNLDALSNVFLAAMLAGVERVIFASSNHAMGGYRELGDMLIGVELPPRPDSPYGATKLMGERLGRGLSAAFEITFIALRLGWVQSGENRPDTLPDEWARAMWLSNRDVVQLFECAIEAELDDPVFVIANGMSNNRGMRWDLTETIELLGYEPEDDAYAEEL